MLLKVIDSTFLIKKFIHYKLINTIKADNILS